MAIDFQKEPWMTGNNAEHAKWSASSYGKKNAYAIYATGIDRFLILEGFSLFTALEVARILSSKIPVQVFLLGKDVPEISNVDCHEYTIFNKKSIVIDGSNMLTAKQTPVVNALTDPDAIKKVGIPKDYQSSEYLEMFFKLKKYAFFVMRCVNAINISDAVRNTRNLNEIIDAYMPDSIPEDFNIMIDYSTATYGIKNTIKSILYKADSIEDALSQIENLWYDSGYMMVTHRNTFYHYLGIPVPERLTTREFVNLYTPKAV